MDIYLERYNLSKLNQEEIEKLNRPITSMGIETNQISSSKKKKSPGRIRWHHRYLEKIYLDKYLETS